jgi:hypothetical protein
LEGYSAPRLSEARKIVKHSRDLAKEVVAGTCTFQEALAEATTLRMTAPIIHHSRPAQNVALTIITTPHTAQIVSLSTTPTRALPDQSQKDPEVEGWLVDWRPETLADRIFAADRIEPGYAPQVIDALNERTAMRH